MAPQRDLLLSAARLVTAFFIAALGLAAAALLLSIPFLFIFQGQAVVELTKEGVEVGPGLFPSVALVLAGAALLLAMAVYFLLLLRRIVLSVGDGDPFIPENADRLSRMGWTVLAGQLAAIPVGALVAWIAHQVEDTPARAHFKFDSDFGFSGSGLLLMLVLFILARVFRRGAEMRDELEGTV